MRRSQVSLPPFSGTLPMQAGTLGIPPAASGDVHPALARARAAALPARSLSGSPRCRLSDEEVAVRTSLSFRAAKLQRDDAWCSINGWGEGIILQSEPVHPGRYEVRITLKTKEGEKPFLLRCMSRAAFNNLITVTPTMAYVTA